MAIKISNVTVIDDDRKIVNVATIQLESNGRISGVVDVLNDNDASNKVYVDNKTKAFSAF